MYVLPLLFNISEPSRRIFSYRSIMLINTKLLLHVEAGRIVNPEDLSGAPEWAKPIIAAAMVAYEGR